MSQFQAFSGNEDRFAIPEGVNPAQPVAVAKPQKAQKAKSGFSKEPSDQPAGPPSAGFCAVTEEERMVWRALVNVPFVPTPFSYIFLVLNIVFPGSGTICSAFFGAHFNKLMLGLGLVQLGCTSIFLLGWLWSFIWGLLIVHTSWGEPAVETLLSQAQAQMRSDKQVPGRAPEGRV